MPTVPGWYRDPDDASTLRWWDGQGWASAVSPPIFDAEPDDPEAQPEPELHASEPATPELSEPEPVTMVPEPREDQPPEKPPYPPPPPPPWIAALAAPPPQPPPEPAPAKEPAPIVAPPEPEAEPAPAERSAPAPTSTQLPVPPELGDSDLGSAAAEAEVLAPPAPGVVDAASEPALTEADSASAATADTAVTLGRVAGRRVPIETLVASMSAAAEALRQDSDADSGSAATEALPPPRPADWSPAPLASPTAARRRRSPARVLRRGRRLRRGWLPVVAGAILVVAVLAAAFLVLRDEQQDLTFDGDRIDQAGVTLADAEDTLRTIVEQRNGAINDQSRCYFSLPDGDTSDINDHLRCGPVLFVDGDPDQAYLTFALQPREGAAEEGTVRLVAAESPESPEPTGLGQDEVLRRPDGESPPENAGGLEAPPPPRAEPGLLQRTSLDGVDLEELGPDARIGAYSEQYRLVGLAQPDRFGRGEGARRPAEGERFVAARLEQVAGDYQTSATTPPVVAIQVGEAVPVPLPEQTAPTDTGFVISVSVDTERVDLVVTERGIEQRLSLLTGEPNAANIGVLRRDNREQQLDAAADLVFNASAPGRVPGNFTVTVTITQVGLAWFVGSDGSQHPTATNRAYLVPDVAFVWDPALNLGPDASLDAAGFNLSLPDGTVIPASNLAPPGQVLVAFDVPADFTEGTLTVGGQFTLPDGVGFDFGASQLQAAVSIPAD